MPRHGRWLMPWESCCYQPERPRQAGIWGTLPGRLPQIRHLPGRNQNTHSRRHVCPHLRVSAPYSSPVQYRQYRHCRHRRGRQRGRGACFLYGMHPRSAILAPPIAPSSLIPHSPSPLAPPTHRFVLQEGKLDDLYDMVIRADPGTPSIALLPCSFPPLLLVAADISLVYC